MQFYVLKNWQRPSLGTCVNKGSVNIICKILLMLCAVLALYSKVSGFHWWRVHIQYKEIIYTALTPRRNDWVEMSWLLPSSFLSSSKEFSTRWFPASPHTVPYQPFHFTLILVCSTKSSQVPQLTPSLPSSLISRLSSNSFSHMIDLQIKING